MQLIEIFPVNCETLPIRDIGLLVVHHKTIIEIDIESDILLCQYIGIIDKNGWQNMNVIPIKYEAAHQIQYDKKAKDLKG